MRTLTEVKTPGGIWLLSHSKPLGIYYRVSSTTESVCTYFIILYRTHRHDSEHVGCQVSNTTNSSSRPNNPSCIPCPRAITLVVLFIHFIFSMYYVRCTRSIGLNDRGTKSLIYRPAGLEPHEHGAPGAPRVEVVLLVQSIRVIVPGVYIYSLLRRK